MNNNNDDRTRVDLSTPQSREYWVKEFDCSQDVLTQAYVMAGSGSVESVGSAVMKLKAQRVPKRKREDDGPSP